MKGDDSKQPAGQWEFAPDDRPALSNDDATPSTPPEQSHSPEVSWTASEFIAHEKGVAWYGVLASVIAVITLVVYLLTHDEISAGIVVFVGCLFGVLAARKPRVLQYRLDDSGVTIGARSYPYSGFRAFVVVEEGAFSSVILLPMQRFAPSLNIYYAPEDEEKVLQALELRLPVDQHRPDVLEHFMRRIRF